MYSLSIMLIIFVSALITKGLIPVIVHISGRHNWFDTPNRRSSHRTPTPRLGGFCMFIATMLTLLLVWGLQSMGLDAGVTQVSIDSQEVWAVSGVMLILLAGLRDDLHHLGVLPKLLAQIGAAVCMWFAGFQLVLPEMLGLSLPLHTLFIFLSTLFVILLCMNAINLIDGIDGLAAGISLNALLFFFYLFDRSAEQNSLCWIAAAIGTIAVFLLYNLYGRQHKIFMGDTGSQLLGLLLSVLGIHLGQSCSADSFVSGSDPWLLTLIFLFLPIADLFRVFIFRLYRGVSPFSADQTHIHHLFLAHGFTHRQTTFLLISLSATFSFTHLWLHPYGSLLPILAAELILFIIAANFIQIKLAADTN